MYLCKNFCIRFPKPELTRRRRRRGRRRLRQRSRGGRRLPGRGSGLQVGRVQGAEGGILREEADGERYETRVSLNM